MLMMVVSVAIVGICLGYAFGVGRPGAPLDLSRALVGLGLAPSFVALAGWASFGLLMPLAPSPVLFAATPPLAAIMVAVLRFRPARWPVRGWTAVSAVALLAVAAVALSPFVDLALAVVRSAYTAHDISVYLMEAGGIAARLQSGDVGWLDWLTYRHPDIAHPHSLAYSFYLAWGFSLAGGTGPDFDTIPKLLVGLTIASTGAACTGLLTRGCNIYWGLAATLVVFAIPLWNNEIIGLSREGFYIAPLVALVGLLMRSEPVGRRRQGWLLAGQALALAGVLLGHSLGLVYAAAVVAGCGVALLVREGPRALAVPSRWLTPALLALGGMATGYRYFTGSSSLGFAYTNYVDPFHVAVMQAAENAITRAPGLAALAGRLLTTNGISSLHLFAVAAGGGMLAWRAAHRRRLPPFGHLWIALALSVFATLVVIWALPVRLEGASLAAAFMRNFRYGLPLGCLVALLATCSVGIIVLALAPHIRPRGLRLVPGALLFMSLAYATHGNAAFHDTASLSRSMAKSAARLERGCALAETLAPRRILVDDDLLFYVCKSPMLYAFTPRGAAITGAEGEAAATALEAEQVDAVILLHSPTWWSGARLYRFLRAAAAWQHTVDDASSLEVFSRLRPDRGS